MLAASGTIRVDAGLWAGDTFYFLYYIFASTDNHPAHFLRLQRCPFHPQISVCAQSQASLITRGWLRLPPPLR